MFIPGHQEVQGHQVTDCDFEHLMIFADDWVDKGKPRRYVKVSRNFSSELFNMSHFDGSQHIRIAGPSNEVTEVSFLVHAN